MNNMIRVGVVGLGIMGQRMLAAFDRHPKFELFAFWDPAPQPLAQQQKQYPMVKATTNANELFSLPVDTVYIASPPKTHLDYIRKTVEAGMGVFCEKPLAVDVTAARETVEFVQARQVANAINFPFATAPAVSSLLDCIQRGEQGKINRIEMHFHFSEWPRTWQSGASSWLSGSEQGGFVREVVSHFAYLTHCVVGHCDIEFAHVSFGDAGNSESYIMASLVAGGVPVTMSGGVGGQAPDYNAWTLYGSNRSFRLQDWGQLHVANAGRWFDVLPETANATPMSLQLDALADTLNGKQSLPDLQTGLQVQELVEALLEYSHEV